MSSSRLKPSHWTERLRSCWVVRCTTFACHTPISGRRSSSAWRMGGLNAVLVPLPWAYHSPEVGFHDFTGPRDLGRLFDDVERAGLGVTAPGAMVVPGWRPEACPPGHWHSRRPVRTSCRVRLLRPVPLSCATSRYGGSAPLRSFAWAAEPGRGGGRLLGPEWHPRRSPKPRVLLLTCCV